MKTSFITVLFTLSSLFCFAQDTESEAKQKLDSLNNRKNELKIGTIKLLAGPILDVEYERIINNYSSLGGNLILNLNTDNYASNFSLSPFFRIYFSESKDYGTKGFFAQAFLNYDNGDSEEYFSDPSNSIFETRTETYNSFGIGFGVGKKWVNHAGFVLQLSIGGSRTIVGDDFAPQGAFLGDLSVGYRF